MNKLREGSFVWDGRIAVTKRPLDVVMFRLEPELIEELNKVENKSKLIRDAVKEKLKFTKV